MWSASRCEPSWPHTPAADPKHHRHAFIEAAGSNSPYRGEDRVDLAHVLHVSWWHAGLAGDCGDKIVEIPRLVRRIHDRRFEAPPLRIFAAEAGRRSGMLRHTLVTSHHRRRPALAGLNRPSASAEAAAYWLASAQPPSFSGRNA